MKKIIFVEELNYDDWVEGSVEIDGTPIRFETNKVEEYKKFKKKWDGKNIRNIKVQILVRELAKFYD